MSGPKAFFDTNVLLYMFSSAEPAKRDLAKELFTRHTAENSLILSTQVVQEFYVAGSRKLSLSKARLRELSAALLDLPLVSVSPSHILHAMENEERYRISFWDALIVAAADAGGARVIYTEDLNDGQAYGAVTVHNPFRGLPVH